MGNKERKQVYSSCKQKKGKENVESNKDYLFVLDKIDFICR